MSSLRIARARGAVALLFVGAAACSGRVFELAGVPETGLDDGGHPTAAVDSGVAPHDGGGAVDSGRPPVDTGVAPPDDGGATVTSTCPAVIDPANPPANCGPNGIPICDPNTRTNLSACPASPCLASVAQTPTHSNLRLATLRIFEPAVFVSIATIAFEPTITPACMGGSETWNWLVELDEKAQTLRTGGARYAADHATYAYLDGQSLTGGDLSAACAGGFDAGGPTAIVNLASVTTTLKPSAAGATSLPISLVNLPVYPDTKPTSLPIVLPLTNLAFRNVTTSNGGTCVGKFDDAYSCDGDTLGWTPNGAISAQIKVTDADRVPIVPLGCKSLCSLLIGDAKSVKGSDGKLHCPKDASGAYAAVGDSCSTGGSCKDAFALTATFAAYGVAIH
jgi:hypothetical protein